MIVEKGLQNGSDQVGHLYFFGRLPPRFITHSDYFGNITMTHCILFLTTRLVINATFA